MATKTRPYLCEGSFSFIQESNAPDAVRKSLIKLINKAGFNDKNFDIKVGRFEPDIPVVEELSLEPIKVVPEKPQKHKTPVNPQVIPPKVSVKRKKGSGRTVKKVVKRKKR
jgi:hypothetical protein